MSDESDLYDKLMGAFDASICPSAVDRATMRRILRSSPAVIQTIAEAVKRVQGSCKDKILEADLSDPSNVVKVTRLQGKAEGAMATLEALIELVDEEEDAGTESGD